MASSSKLSHGLLIQLVESTRNLCNAFQLSNFDWYSFTAKSRDENAPTAVPNKRWYFLKSSHFAACWSRFPRTTANATTTSAGSLSRSMYCPVFKAVCSRNSTSSTSEMPTFRAFIISGFLASTKSTPRAMLSRKRPRASFKSSRRTWSAAGIFISYSTSIANMSSTVACSVVYKAFALRCFWCVSTKPMNPSSSSGRPVRVFTRLPKLPPLLIASSRAFTSNKAFMLSSIPCTVFSSPLRSGLPSTKTQPTVVLVFILSSESCHPFCTSISARNVLTVFGVFSYKSWSHPNPNS
mmetsp:Transcript_7035/g.26585  ORF Transcript_7035/g.26585 Transcript_7035/m.26585 type:complete len:295 (+) Transcript_7035:1769-2653(+)